MKTSKKEARFQVINPDVVYQNGIPQPEPFDSFEDVYGIHVWVYACANLRANAFSAIDILPYIQKSDGEWIVNQKHDFYRHFLRPNPYMTMQNVKEILSLSFVLTGNAYMALQKDMKGDITEIWPIPSSRMRPVTTREQFVSHYIFEVNGHPIRFEADEIIHFRAPSSTSLSFGQGTISAVKNSIAADLFAETWNKNFMANSGRPDAILTSDQSVDDTTRKRVIESWKKMHEGPKKVGRMALLGGGLKYQEVNRTHKDMDFVMLRKMARDEVLSVMGVPQSMVGIMEYANYSNMKEQTKIFWTQTMIPQIRTFENTLTMRAQQITFDLKTVFQADLSKVEALRADEKERSTIAKAYVDMGIPLNSVIEALDLPFESVEGGDVSRPASSNFNQPTNQEPQKALKALPKKTKEVPADAIDLKEMAWRKFDRQAKDREDEMIVSLRAFFRGQKRRVLDALEKNKHKVNGSKSLHVKNISDTINLLFDFDEEQAVMSRAVGNHIKGAFFEFARSTASAINPSFDFSLQDPVSLAWIDAKKIKLVREASQHTKEKISEAVVSSIEDALAQGFSDSETIADIADRIDEIYKFAVEGRSERIARTEIISASNAGATEGMKKTGVEKKEWLDSRDERVRETHKSMGGQVVGINQPFVSPEGAQLLFPGDPNAPASEVVNCRCTILPVLED